MVGKLVNPRHTGLQYLVCLYVCVCVFTLILELHATKQLMNDTNGFSTTIARNVEISVNVSTSICSGIDSLLKTVKSDVITDITLSDTSPKTMACVHSILLHCPSLTRLKLKRTELQYDGILYICDALRYNTTLKYLEIHGDIKIPWSEWVWIRTQPEWQRPDWWDGKRTLPSASDQFFQKLRNILKENTTLEELKIKSTHTTSPDWYTHVVGYRKPPNSTARN